MIRFNRKSLRVAAAVAMMFAAQAADAQWVLLAKKAVGRVEQMSQSQPNGASYDSATVIIDAPADKVWAAVVRGVRGKAGLNVTQEDAGGRLIQFTDGQQVAGIKVSMLSDELSQLMVSSAHTGNQGNAAVLVSDAVLRVCREMNVECSR